MTLSMMLGSLNRFSCALRSCDGRGRRVCQNQHSHAVRRLRVSRVPAPAQSHQGRPRAGKSQCSEPCWRREVSGCLGSQESYFLCFKSTHSYFHIRPCVRVRRFRKDKLGSVVAEKQQKDTNGTMRFAVARGWVASVRSSTLPVCTRACSVTSVMGSVTRKGTRHDVPIRRRCIASGNSADLAGQVPPAGAGPSTGRGSVVQPEGGGLVLEVAVLGLPNVGKSTLTNALIGRKVSPVTQPLRVPGASSLLTHERTALRSRLSPRESRQRARVCSG